MLSRTGIASVALALVTAQLPAQTTTAQYTSTTSDDRISNQTRDPLEISADLLAALDSAKAFSTFRAEATPMPDQANFELPLPDRQYRQEKLPDIDRYLSDSLEDEIALALASHAGGIKRLEPLADTCAMYGYGSFGFANPLYFDFSEHSSTDESATIIQQRATYLTIQIPEGTLEEQAEDIKILLSELIRAEPEGIAIDCPATLNVDRYNFEIAQRLRDMHEILGLEPHQSRELPRLSEKLGELLASPAENLDNRDIQGIRAAERIVSAALEAGLHPGIALRDVGYVTGRNGHLAALSANSFVLQVTSWLDGLRVRIYPNAETNEIELRDNLVTIRMTDGDYNVMQAIFEAFPDLSTFRHLRYLDVAGQQFKLIDSRLESIFNELDIPAKNRDDITTMLRRDPPVTQYNLRHYDVLAWDEDNRTALARKLVEAQSELRNGNSLDIIQEPTVVPFVSGCYFIGQTDNDNRAFGSATQVEVKLSDNLDFADFSGNRFTIHVGFNEFTTLDQLIDRIQAGINRAFSLADQKAQNTDWLPAPSCELNTQSTADDIAIDVLLANRAYFQGLIEARTMVLDAVPELSYRFDDTGINSSTIREEVKELNAWTIALTEYGILDSIFYFIDAPLVYFIDHFYLTELEQFNYRIPWKFDSDRNTIVYPLADKTRVRITRSHLEIHIAHDATQAELERLTPLLQGDPDAIKAALLVDFPTPPRLVFDGRRSLLAP